ncbi:MAG TPA: rhodanese-like domain-containing protein, partial [Thermodesulfobacteriota bacterium]|nr:rhodanese-like domain-containing protein [Thermodesulfobacteriota bacterium]
MLKKMITDGQELALLDPREEGSFSDNHLLLAVNIPLSRLETRIGDLVPRKTTRIVLADEGEGLSERTALRLKELGYQNISILEGGVGSWKAAGYEVFSGVNVPTKAFGEWVEHHYNLSSITPEELDAKFRSGEKLILLDSRTPEEYRRFTLPGSLSVPGAELVYRYWELPVAPDTLVVVHCAGRTRSIIGAQSLINAGVKNRVVAFRGGTMAWELAGFTTEKDATRSAPEPSEKALREAQSAAAQVAKRFGVRTIDAKKLAQFERERNRRTLYLFDVRTREEYLNGHLPKSVHAPGGQLVQAIDTYVATRNSRIVLIDQQTVRAQMTASWLVQAGWPDVFVLANPFSGTTLERGERTIDIPGLDGIRLPVVKPAELQDLMKSGGTAVIDFTTSLNYGKGHIPGAWFAVRSRLGEGLMKIPAADRFVLTGDDLKIVTLAG